MGLEAYPSFDSALALLLIFLMSFFIYYYLLLLLLQIHISDIRLILKLLAG